MYLSIDVGGTKTRIDASEDLRTIVKHYHFSTLKSPNELVKKIKYLFSHIDGIILGLPGVLNKEKSELINSPNLNKSWVNLNFKELLKELTSNIFCQNDAALAGLAEAVLGGGKNYNIVVYLTISTGVGGVKIINKQIEQNNFGFEPGHQIIIENGRPCSCGQRGCLKAYVSGSAFQEIYKKEPKFCTNQNYWNKYAKYLGQGLINIITIWSPEILILGGSMLNEPIYFFNPLMEYLKNNLKIVPMPQIKISQLKDDAGTLGGFLYLKQMLESVNNTANRI